MLKVVHILASVLLYLATSVFPFSQSTAAPTLEAPMWPTWVHEHWVWENEGTQESAMAHVESFLERDIPVGAMIIDRPWATAPTTFDPDPERYGDLEQYVDTFHDMGVRVIMWATSVINEDASTFQEARDKGYFLSNGKTVKWWAGTGAFIDYTNPEAVEWWHSQMDKVLEMGIDGWKIDGTDPYMMLLFPAIGKSGKILSWADYRDMTYRDFYEYSREKYGADKVISGRPVDDLLFKIGVPITYAPRDVNFAGWVGDNDNDWNGLKHALNNMFSSTLGNNVSYGSDIGGFRSDGNKYKDVFIRWAQLGAFCPIMENGGGGEHRPWMFDDTNETTDIYRKFVKLHHELIPYIYSSAAYSYEIEKPTMRPQLGEYTYLLGEDLLVAPFFEEGNDRTIFFPKGEWIYMFDETKVYSQGIKTLEFPLDEFPVFIRKGSIIPLEVVSDAAGHGSELSADYTTIMIYPKNGTKQFGLYEEQKDGTMLSYKQDDSSLTITSTESERSFLFRVCDQTEPTEVTAGGAALTEADSMAALTAMSSGYFFDGENLWIAVSDVTAGAEIVVK